MKKIFGFYHVGFIGRWKSIFDAQVQKMKVYGILDSTETVFVGTCGNGVLELPHEKFKIAVANPQINDGEVETIRFLYSFCQSNSSCLVWYMHTKGASVVLGSSTEHHGPNTENVIKNVDAWRRYMEHYCLKRHKQCAADLRSYDICGTEWRKVRRPHFAGNFWWATSEFVAGIENPMSTDEKGYSGRYAAESDFIGKRDGKVKNYFSHNKDLYWDGVKPSDYLRIKHL